MNDSNDMWYKGGDAMEELELFYQHKNSYYLWSSIVLSMD